jgi:hypothetical protein
MKNELWPQDARGEGLEKLRVTQESNPSEGFRCRAHRRFQGVVDGQQFGGGVQAAEGLQQLAANESGRTGHDDPDGWQAIGAERTRGISVSSHGIQRTVAVTRWGWGDVW